MKRIMFLAAVLAVALEPATGRAAAPGSPEDVVERAYDALNHGRVDAFVKAMHPDALKQTRTWVLEILEMASKKGEEGQLLEGFQVENVEKLKALDGSQLMAAMLGKALADPDVKKAMASTRIEAIGRFAEGNEKSYVVFRSRMRFGEMPIDRLNVAGLQKSEADWKLMLMDDVETRLMAMKRAAAGEMSFPDPQQTKIEPLGHVMEGRKTAMIVYRATVPLGDGSFSKLSVLAVNAGDPGWDAARKDDKDGVRAVVEKSLGIRKATPEEAAARKAQAEQMLAEARARLDVDPAPSRGPEGRRPGSGRADDRRAEMESRLAEMKARTRKMHEDAMQQARGGLAADANSEPSPAGSAVEDSPAGSTGALPGAGATSPLPEGLTAVPASFLGGDRGRFLEVAPEGGVLVGARVSYASRPGGPKISSIQPIFRVGGKLVDGERHGSLLGKETKVVARDGYAVGALKTRTGIMVDGFELVFMKIDGERLDPSRSYSSAWLGNERTGVPRDVSSNGRIPVGLQGREGDGVHALGLIIGK